MNTIMLATFVLVSTVLQNVHCTSSLSFLIPSGNDECLYIQKSAGDQISASFQVIHGDHITFTLLDPQSKVIYTKERSDGFDLEQRVHIPGDYGFCFNNQNSREETGVSFEWDFHLGNQEDATFKKKLEDEKRRYVMNQINQNKPKVVVAHENAKVKPVEMAHDEQLFHDLSMDTIAHATILLSFNFDRMMHYISMHKSKMALSHNLQIKNASYISYYSIGICALIVVMGLLQVIVVKSFFSGQLNFKVWQF